ncbi:tigger transposable element-derived protein 7-like [Portunus trituberculatus]|uniref:tigger transposable element-derived protein 7-like n=1 Tax=Portunus trituberculatus TaxID=210409 RepID=UPI001E1CDA32|nr:tigger transposable element-derived protein 7-like [Portunus trituberculatus]
MSGSVAPHKHMKIGSQKQLDEAVYKWYVQQKACGNKVTSGTIRNACEQLSKHLGIQFSASDGWLWRFRNRYGLRDLVVRGEAGSADTVSAEVYRVKLNELIKDEGLLMSQVYNANETGLFWRSLPKSTQARKDEEVMRGKMCKERISALCYANADDMHQHKLVIVGKSARPHALKDHMHTLPVHYYHSRKAWFNVLTFSDWFFKHFVPEVRRYQEDVLKFNLDDVSALLLLDNAPAHPSADKLVSADGKIRILYLPANTTSLIQPMDQGVISAV